MSNERATLEMIAPTVEEAIANGLAELGLSENDVEVEVLDEGNKGFMGLGGRQCRVRLSINEGADPAPKPAIRAAPADEKTENNLAITRETVEELLEKMHVTATVEAFITDVTDREGNPAIFINITGNDLSILIGRKAETLNALQYITRLIVGKELGHGTTIQLDVEGYRERRELNLRKLAKKMAQQAITTGRRQTLEPMPANERRIVHMALADNGDVLTESLGDDPRRKVTISPI